NSILVESSAGALLGLAGGLFACSRKLQPVRVLPLLWLATGFLVLALHRPLWPHHVLILCVPIAWIAALSMTLFRASTQRLTMAGSLVLFSAIAVFDFQQASSHQFQAQPPEMQTQFFQDSAANAWVVTDSPIDAYRAHRLVPPELA